MKAIIMAGGEGKRLRAVSGDTPKPMVMLCGRPILEHIILLLREHGITKLCVTLGYRPEVIREYFGDGSRWGVDISWHTEEKPLGTAGGVRSCADFYGDEDLLVISGDAVCDIDLGRLISEHKKHSPAVTLALCRRSEPLRYGLCLCDGEGYVRSFIEKPDWGRVVTDLVNTGIYVVSPRAMALVPENSEYDFGKELFPELLRRGESLLGVPCEGYWCDIGTPQSYYQCCVDALSGKLRISPAGGFVTAPESDRRPEPEESGERVSCRDRARLMGSLSAAFLELGATVENGLAIRGEGYELCFRAAADAPAVCVSVSSEDAELASELSLSAVKLVKDIEKRLE